VKSQQSLKLRILDYVFLNAASKNVKTYSRTMAVAAMEEPSSGKIQMAISQQWVIRSTSCLVHVVVLKRCFACTTLIWSCDDVTIVIADRGVWPRCLASVSNFTVNF